MPADPAGAARARLVWHCRRGTLELDLLLQRWLARDYALADAPRRACFEALLELPDPLLADYLLAGLPPPDPQLAELVKAIRGLAASVRAPAKAAPDASVGGSL